MSNENASQNLRSPAWKGSHENTTDRFLGAWRSESRTPMIRLQGDVPHGPVGMRAAEVRLSGRRRNPRAKGDLQPSQHPARPASKRGGIGGRTGKARFHRIPKNTREKVVINWVSHRRSRRRLQFWHPSGSQAEGFPDSRGHHSPALPSLPPPTLTAPPGQRRPRVLRHPDFCHSGRCRSEIVLTAQCILVVRLY